MNPKYLRLPQDASDLFLLGNEKGGNDHRPRLISWKNLILSLSVVINVFLSVSAVLMLRERPTPIGFGKNRQVTHVSKRRLTGLSQSRPFDDDVEPVLVEHGLQPQEPLG